MNISKLRLRSAAAYGISSGQEHYNRISVAPVVGNRRWLLVCLEVYDVITGAVAWFVFGSHSGPFDPSDYFWQKQWCHCRTTELKTAIVFRRYCWLLPYHFKNNQKIAGAIRKRTQTSVVIFSTSIITGKTDP